MGDRILINIQGEDIFSVSSIFPVFLLKRFYFYLMMKRIIIAGGMLFFAVSHLWSASCGPIVANPINLNYKFGLTEGDGKPWREAADPVLSLIHI